MVSTRLAVSRRPSQRVCTCTIQISVTVVPTDFASPLLLLIFDHYQQCVALLGGWSSKPIESDYEHGYASRITHHEEYLSFDGVTALFVDDFILEIRSHEALASTDGRLESTFHASL